MTTVYLGLPLELDPLIAEAKRRMRRRRLLLATAAIVVAAMTTALITGPLRGGPRGGSLGSGQAPHSASVYRLGWTIPVHIHGRLAMRVRVYWLKVSASHWSVRASVVNRSGHTLRPLTTGKTGWGLNEVTIAQRAHPSQCTWSTCRGFAATSFRPALPRTLRPGESWTVIFGGSGRPSHHWLVDFSLRYYLGWPSPGGFGVSNPGELGAALHIP